MTRLNDDNFKKVERLLSEAHRSRPEPSLDANWLFLIMQDIRREAKGHGQSVMKLRLDWLVWRTAAVAAVLALVFTGSIFFHTNPDAVELTMLLSNELDVLMPLSE